MKYHSRTPNKANTISLAVCDRDVKLITDHINQLTRLKMPKGLSFARVVHDKELDNHSLVFEIASEALFLSDLHEGPMNDMAARYFPLPKDYALVKSAHHGNRLGGLLKKKLRNIRGVLHCCGSANGNYGGPNLTYSELAPECIIRTDLHAEEERPYSNGCCASRSRCRFDAAMATFAME
ncbi:MAG TPA: hypothetical protein VGP72_12170 [Planctomycetota bacterium]|jgi:hypothetical protein